MSMNIFYGKKLHFLTGIAVVAIGLEFLWPGNIPFLRDEALLVWLALDANEAGRLATHGLMGTVSISYGALIVWFNQLLLHFTTDPVMIASIKTLLSVGISLAALWRMAKLWHLPLSPAAALWFASPFVFFYQRAMWDNVWLLPLSLGFFACAAHYWRNSDWRALAGAALLLDAMVYLHPVALPLPGAFAVTLLILRRRAPWREWAKILGVGVAAALLISPYLWGLLHNFATEPVSFPPGQVATDAALCFANLTGSGFLERFAPEQSSFLWFGAVTAATIVIAGFILLGAVALRNAKRRREWSSFDSTVLLAALTVVIYIAMIFILRRQHHAHYNSAVTAAWLLLAWRGYVALQIDSRKIANIALGAALAIQLTLIAVFMVRVETARGSASDHLGPVMTEQCNAARVLLAAYRKNPKLEVVMAFDRFQREPESLQLLIKLAEGWQLPEVPVFRRLTIGPAADGFGILLVGEE